MSNSPQISVIIPVYNAEEYIHACLDSILNQTYVVWEAILIDDGSPDSSGTICDKYAEIDSRFKVIHKKNGGVSSARNSGLDIARGDYICFVDSDDSLTIDALESMVETIIREDADVCLCPVVKAGIQSDNSIRILTPKEKNDLIWACIAYRTDRYVREAYMVDAPHGKLFRHSVIQQHQLRFIDGLSKSEDAIFDAYFYHYSRSVVFYAHQVYHYTINPISICHTFNWKFIDMLVWVLREEEKFADTFYVNDVVFHNAIYVRSYIGLQQLLHESGTKSLSFLQHIKAIRLYLNSDIVHRLLYCIPNKNFQYKFSESLSSIELFLAKRRLSALLYIWVRSAEFLFNIRVFVVEKIKHSFGLKEDQAIRYIFQRNSHE